MTLGMHNRRPQFNMALDAVLPAIYCSIEAHLTGSYKAMFWDKVSEIVVKHLPSNTSDTVSKYIAKWDRKSNPHSFVLYSQALKKPLLFIDSTGTATAWLQSRFGSPVYLEEAAPKEGPLVICGLKESFDAEKLKSLLST